MLISLAILGRYMTVRAQTVQYDAKQVKTSPSSFWAQGMGFYESIGAFISHPIPFIPSDDSIWFYSAETHQTIRAKVTGYSSEVEQTDETPTITASGTSTRSGVAACPRWISFGTRISIGGKIYECFDRLAKKYDDRFDIWFADTASAREWGIQETDVVIHD